jgi:imidazolonepropionase-like amidohydrolase
VFARGLVRRAGRDVRPARRGRVIDVGGAFVLPGLLDAHVHAATVAAARLAVAGGATTVRSASTSFYQDVGLRALGKLGGLGVPRTLAAGLFVTPNLGDSIVADPRLAPLATLPDGVRSPEALRYLVRVNIARGVDLIKTRSTERAGLPEQDPRVQVYDQRQIRAVVNAARRLPAGVACHGHGDEGIRDSVRAGVRSVEHGTFASAATLDLMRARGTYLVPTLSAVVDLAETGGEYTDPRLVERGREMLAVLRVTVPAAYERGIPIAAGTDTSYTPATQSSIVGEIRLLAQFGLSNLDALRAATTTGAALVRRRRQLGRIAPGYAADAVVVGGDPLADLAHLDDVRLVVAGGWIAREGDEAAA